MRIFPGRDEGEDPLFCQMQSVCAAASIDGYDSAEFAGMLELFPAWFEFCLCGRTFFKILKILSASGSVRAEFGGGGRQKRVIHPVFCLLPDPREPNLEAAVDYWMFCPAFTNACSAFSERTNHIFKALSNAVLLSAFS